MRFSLCTYSQKRLILLLCWLHDMFEELHTLSEPEQLKSEIMMMPAFDASIMSRMLSNIDT
ncbi:hypothetical protein VCR26J2_350250 [Vibrio coralliirubri]|nr:hypothetical protein VCR1J2_20245 [Vibrio coralliirubri]CDT68750.1 hypothetical protein VCR26J2_350250 [Vibrio coralliirubri]CDU14241.1 hypothetical protein VCR17J2_620127 [Vibrio coralliirubri]